jgi:hypothetical protein
MTDIYTANSKEVLRNGVHFADAVDDDAAQVIVSAMSELHGLRVQIEVHEKLGPARERQFAKCRDERDTQRAGIIAHLEADATLRRLAELQASNKTMKSLSGQERDETLAIYTAGADQIRLADEAVTMLARWEMQEDRAKAGQEYRFTAND